MSTSNIQINRVAIERTVRLVTTARLRESVLACLAETQTDMDALFEIEGATSTRLQGQDRGLESIAANEFVFGVPHAKFINAAFAYAKPNELNRYNGSDRGAWYAALETVTCVHECKFHLTEFLRRTGSYLATVQYSEMFASLAGDYADLRGTSHESLDPDPAIAYPIGNALANTIRAEGHNGIIYPSVRHTGGTCVVALWPHAVQSVAQGDVVEMRWTGRPEPTIETLPKADIL